MQPEGKNPRKKLRPSSLSREKKLPMSQSDALGRGIHQIHGNFLISRTVTFGTAIGLADIRGFS